MKSFRTILCLFLTLALLASMAPVYAVEPGGEAVQDRGIHNPIYIDDDPADGYTGDYVVIYNPDTLYTSSRSTGSMSGLIQTSVSTNGNVGALRSAEDEARPYKIDVDQMLADIAKTATIKEPIATRASYSVGSTKTFNIYSTYSPTGSGSVQFKCLYVGQHCYIWTPSSSANNTYPLDTIDESFAKLAADEFDSKFDLMQSSFGNHTNGSSGDGKLHMLYYNINDGWQPGQGYIAGFFYSPDIGNNGLPILNIDTYPGVLHPSSNGNYSRMDDTYNTMVHEYQHLINYSNTPGMHSWLNECFSAAAEEICYPGSSVVSRIQAWENYYYSNDWLNPPSEFAYQPGFSLHNGYSLYDWSNELSDVLALYAQVSFFSQYLYTRFGNTIFQQISSNWSSGKETTAITNATGVDCSRLARDFRVALTANAPQTAYNGIYGFKAQDDYNPSNYHNVENPWSLLAPIVFTGSSCNIKGGGAITVKPVNGVYNPPADADDGLQYVGVSLSSPYTVTAVSNNTNYGTVSVNGRAITAAPKNGYYASGYTVTAGSATVFQNRNIFTVDATSNCTVRINFAAKPSYTVNYISCGQSVGSQSAKLYDEITLPASVNVQAADWTFSGWTAQQIQNESTEKPVCFAPGASYEVTGNTTLYALFTRKEQDGSNCYRLVSAAPADWSGTYVITSGTDSSMHLMKGVAVSSNGADIENASNTASYASSGVLLEEDTLHNVADAYLFTMAPHGSNYSLQNVATGVYLGVASDSSLAGYNAYASGSCDWTPGPGSSASSMKNAQNGKYPYIEFNGSYFWTNVSVDTSIRFWKESSGYITYYSTSPVTAAPLAITTQPQDYIGPIGNTARFTIEAQGDGLTYQWQFQSANSTDWYNSSMTGYNTNTLSVQVVSGRNGQKYRCIVMNKYGQRVISEAATIIVGTPLTITTQPQDYMGPIGNTARFTVEAQGDGLTYLWQFQSANSTDWYNSSMTGYNTNTLSVQVASGRNGQKYRCIVTDKYGQSVTSNAVTLTVESTPEDPEDGTIGKALGDYPTADACIKPNAFVDLIHTVQIWGAYDRTGNNTPDNTTDDTPAMLSIVSPLKSSAENYLSKGNIYMDDIDALYPENENKWVYQVEMTGNEIYYWLEFAASKLKKDSTGKIYVPSTQIKNYDVIMGEGFHYEIDMTKAAGERVFNMTYNGQTVKANQKFTVVMNSDRFNSSSPYVMYLFNEGFCEFDPEERLIYSTETDMTNGQSEGHIRALLISYIRDQTAKNGGITPTIISDWSVRNGNN